MKQKFYGVLLAFCLVAFAAGCGESKLPAEEEPTEELTAWGQSEGDFTADGMELGKTTSAAAEATLGNAVSGIYEITDDLASGRMPQLQYVVEAGESCYYFGSYDPTLEQNAWTLFMAESTSAGAKGPRGIAVGDTLASVKEKFPTKGADGEMLYRIEVQVTQGEDYNISEVYKAVEQKDAFFHTITFSCGYEDSQWFARYTLTFENDIVTGYTLSAF